MLLFSFNVISIIIITNKQYYCDRRRQYKGPCRQPSQQPKNADWTSLLQYVVLEYEEAVYLSQVCSLRVRGGELTIILNEKQQQQQQLHVYENAEPGSVVSIWAQPAQKGADASPGGGAPANEVVAGGAIAGATTTAPTTLKDQVLDNVDITTADAAATAATNSATSINTNPNNFVQVWTRAGGVGVCLIIKITIKYITTKPTQQQQQQQQLIKNSNSTQSL